MSSSESSNEETIFAEALALPDEARAAFLGRACGADEELRASLEALLRAHREASGFLAADAGLTPVPAAAFIEDRPGDRIGRYKLLQKIGEGGCGIVYMAEQEEPVRRRVALKVIKLGMDTKEVIARFAAERQALALMDHPNIARVLDAGATDAGRPFFVMELVRGVPITRYCDEHSLATGPRLELFTQVCHAIQHAHQKGVIHRDLKPSNILVTLHDGTPMPKVIDFGIAKATQGRLTDHTLFTAFEQFIGTPAYMSPEQAELSALDVDTRSDVYSLGVLLYELLTGRQPFDPKTFLSAGLDEMRRLIREVDPPKPSTRLSTLADTDRTTVAKLRGTAPQELSLTLAGDLDWIVMRCLEKDRTRRYETAAALAVDVQRHLANEPVAARPPSGSYRLRKFCRRHRTAVLAAGAVTLALVAGLVVSAGMFVRERAARQRATAAEQAEGRLRQQAEAARTEEVKRAARTALDLANRNLTDGRIADGLAYLVYAARKDPLNRTLGPRLASVLASHRFLIPQAAPFACGSRVQAVRFAQDGRSFFIGTEDGTFRVMDAASGEVKRQFRTGHQVVPDGWEFAQASDAVVGARFTDNTFALFDVATGELKFPPLQLAPDVGQRESNRVVGISPKGTWIYAVTQQQFWLWRADTGSLQLQLKFDAWMEGCDFTATEDTLAIVVGHTVERWALPSGERLDPPLRFRTVARMPFGTHLRFSPDGRRLAVIEMKSAQVLDVATGAVLHRLPEQGGNLFPGISVFASNDRLLVRLQTQTFWWDLADGRLIPAPLPHALEVSLDATATRGVASSQDGLLRVFDLAGSAPVAEPAWRQSAAYGVAISPGGSQVLMGTVDGLLYRFRLGHEAARPLVLPRPSAPMIPARFLPEPPARLLVATGDRAKVIQVSPGREDPGGFPFPKRQLEPIPDTHAWIGPGSKFMVVRLPDGSWQSCELGAEGISKVIPLQQTPPGPAIVTFSPAGDQVTLANQMVPRVWNLRTGEPVGPPVAFSGLSFPFSVSFSPDAARLAMGARDGTTLVFDVQTGAPRLSLKTRPQVRTWATQFSPDGERILTTDQDGEIRLWSAHTGEPIGPIMQTMKMGTLDRPAFSSRGRWIAVRTPTSVTMLDGRTGSEAGRRIAVDGTLASFSADENRLGTAEINGTATVWDVPSGEAITEPMRHQGEIRLPEFSPDGRFLKTEGAHTSVWAVPPPLPDGEPPPEWLLELATLYASQMVNENGQLVPAIATVGRVDALRHQIATLPADAPLAAWGRWVIDDRPDRPIAPGFTVTPAEADKLAATEAAPPR